MSLLQQVFGGVNFKIPLKIIQKNIVLIFNVFNRQKSIDDEETDK